jgi:hypothetical protein
VEGFIKISEELQEAPQDRSAKEWISTVKADYDHSDIYPDLQLNLGRNIYDSMVGQEPVAQELLDKYQTPITVYSDQHSTMTNLTVICSTPFKELKTSPSAIKRFGRHAAFSTPIQDYKKEATKIV